MTAESPLVRYDWNRSYQWNYDHAPQSPPAAVEIPSFPGEWELCGLPVDSPLGIPAGPLLNGNWCAYYAALGFDVLTYKTVRSGFRPCYELPNLLPVACKTVDEGHSEVSEAEEMDGSWAVSFGMPSADPPTWERDIAQTRNRLGKRQLLSVSVVGTVQDGWTMQQLADDYATCAGRAKEAGAQLVELNFSCPNVSTCDGQLYQNPPDAALVARTARMTIGPDTPLLVKVGHVPDRDAAASLLEAVGPHVDGMAMTNSIATKVRGRDGQLCFDGQLRGICGRATLDASTRQVETVREVAQQMSLPLTIIGVGGASTAADVRRYLDAGADAVHIATAAMVDPLVAVQIRREFAESC